MGEEFVHTEDNEVEYYEARKEGRGTKWVLNYQSNEPSWKYASRHYEINPNAIRVGDIVEVQISFEGIWLKGNRSKMAIILRAITVLDKGVLDVSTYI